MFRRPSRSAGRALALLASLLFAARAWADPPPLTRYALPNGLDVVLAPDPGRAQVAVRVDYAAGLVDDPAGYPETSHLVEHLLFRGTRHSEGPLWRALTDFGATAHNGVTSDGATTYFEVADAAQLDRLLWLESERMGFGLDAITDENVALEGEIVWREHVRRVEENPRANLQGALLAALYPPGHPWRGVGRDVEDRGRLTRDAARWYFQQWYAPGNARLTVVGGFDPERARTSIERWFGPIPERSVPARPPAPTAAPPDRPVEVTLRAPVRAGQVYAGWITPALREPGDAALDVFARRLSAALDAHGEVLAGAAVGQSSRSGASHFDVSLVVWPGADVSAARRALDVALAAALDGCERDDWFDTARRAEAARYASLPDDLVTRAAVVAAAPDPDDPGAVARDAARMQSLDLAGTCAAARRWLDPRRRVTVTVIADPDAPPPYRQVTAEAR